MQSRTSWIVASSFWPFLGWSSSFRPQALVYDQPGFQGSCLEIDADVFSFCQSEAGFSAAGAHVDSKNLKSVGSLKVIGGLWVFFFPTSFSPLTRCCCWTGTSWLCFIGFPQACTTKTDANPRRRSSSSSSFSFFLVSSWVGYSEPGFEGQQHILEEGEYLDCRDWGGSEQLLSLQPVLSVSSAATFNNQGRIAALIAPRTPQDCKNCVKNRKHVALLDFFVT